MWASNLNKIDPDTEQHWLRTDTVWVAMPTAIESKAHELKKDTWFLHHVDRDMVTGAYGGSCLCMNGGSYPIKFVNAATQSVTLGNDRVIHIGAAPSSRALFVATLGALWDTRYKAIWKGDSDYVDYIPAFYPNFDALVNGSSELYMPEKNPDLWKMA